MLVPSRYPIRVEIPIGHRAFRDVRGCDLRAMCGMYVAFPRSDAASCQLGQLVLAELDVTRA